MQGSAKHYCSSRDSALHSPRISPTVRPKHQLIPAQSQRACSSLTSFQCDRDFEPRTEAGERKLHIQANSERQGTTPKPIFCSSTILRKVPEPSTLDLPPPTTHFTISDDSLSQNTVHPSPTPQQCPASPKDSGAHRSGTFAGRRTRSPRSSGAVSLADSPHSRSWSFHL